MIPLIRNIVVIFVLLSIAYAVLSIKARWVQRAKLDAEYTAPDTSKDIAVSKDEYIASGMKKYGKSYRPKLIFGVYLVPIAIIAVLIYLANNT
jgi:hypothetical protein